MTLIARLSTLFLLYFVQGAPYGFQSGCLPLILRKKGMSFTDLGVMKLLFLPWILKPLFAAKIERRKTKWLYISLMGLGTASVLAAYATPEDVPRLSLVLAVLNLLCAVQDICVDCLSVKLLDASELGAANTVQVVAYKFGSAAAVGVLLPLQEHFGWASMFYCLAAVYFICVGALMFFQIVPKDPAISSKETEPFTAVFTELAETCIPGTGWLIFYVLTYKLSDQSCALLPVYLLDKGVSTDYLALGSTVTRFCSIAGSTFSGYLLLRNEPYAVLKEYSIYQTIPLLAKFVIICYWGTAKAEPWTKEDEVLTVLSYIVLATSLFCIGVITTAAFTVMMTLSKSVPNADLQGTHFSSLCTFEILGKLFFASIAGGIGDIMGLKFVYGLFNVLALTNIAVLSKAPAPIMKR